jgi:hypothetical protein
MGASEENFRRELCCATHTRFFACRMFSSRQERSEDVPSWESRIDEMQTELREAVKTVCKPEELLDARGLIDHLAKSCFVQGLHNEWMQTIVRSRNESISLSKSGGFD